MDSHERELRHLTPKEVSKSSLEIDHVELERRLDLLTPPTRQRTENLGDNLELIIDTSCHNSDHPFLPRQTVEGILKDTQLPA